MPKLSVNLRPAARIAAYLLAALVGLIWAVGGLSTLGQPLLDIGVAHTGDVIIKVAGLAGLAGEGTMRLAMALAVGKLTLGLMLLATPVVAVIDRFRFGGSDDALLDVGLFVAAVGAVVATPAAITAPAPQALQALIGELVFCLAASQLAIWGRGEPTAEAETAAPMPAPAEPA